ncbi:MAG: putative bifunctional diguanylate cyclase/phosphodiesterase [Thermodesulfobacteriota bacterium]
MTISDGKERTDGDMPALRNDVDSPGAAGAPGGVRAEQVGLLYGTFPSAALAVLLNSLIIAVVFRDVVPQRTIMMWLGGNAAVTLLRYLLVFRFRSRSGREGGDARWGAYYIAGMAMAGAAFGSSGVFLFPSGSIAHQAFLAFVLGGMVAGAAGLYSMVRGAFVFYSVPALLPIFLRLIIEGGEIHIAMAMMTAIFFTLLLLTSRRMYSTAVKSFELSFRNEHLVSYLSDAKERAERLNEALLKEMEERELAEESLKASEARYRMLHATAFDAIFMADARGAIVECNRSAEEMFGYGRGEVVGRELADLMPGAFSRGNLDFLRRRAEGGEKRLQDRARELQGVRSSGEVFPVELIVSSFTVKGEVFFTGTVRDITERKRSEETVRHLAYHDHLTGLPNRMLILDRIGKALERGKRVGRHSAIIYMDIDRFKEINDTLGHAVGDGLLKAVAARLKKCIRVSDTVSRLGGDEFTILVQDLKKVDYVAIVVEQIFAVLGEPFTIDRHELFVTASIGVSINPADGPDAETLLKNADVAMYDAKKESGNSYRLYTSEMNLRTMERLKTEHRLRRAVDEEELALHYQPQTDVRTGEVVGMEALLRWHHHDGGLVPPGDFIPIAEDTGLIVRIGEWVLRRACAQNKAWQDAGLKRVSVAVNISMRHFKRSGFIDEVSAILEETGLDPGCLELELTESIVMEDAEATVATLRAFKSMGVRLAIDDFGKGYSSLEYLKRMPIDMLKIDRTFIRDITEDSNDASISTAIITLAHSLEVEVLAEGVETAEQLKALGALGCDKAQGFLIARPAPPGEAGEFLIKERRFIA